MTKLFCCIAIVLVAACDDKKAGDGGGAAAPSNETDPFVQQAAALKQEMCACKDVDCGDAVWDKFERVAFEVDQAGDKVAADAKQRFDAVAAEIRACRPR